MTTIQAETGLRSNIQFSLQGGCSTWEGLADPFGVALTLKYMTSTVLDRPFTENISYEPEFAHPGERVGECTITDEAAVLAESARIVAGCREGNAACFSELVDIYASRCYGYFYRLTGDRDLSDEFLSQLFLKLVVKIDSYKGGIFDCWR